MPETTDQLLERADNEYKQEREEIYGRVSDGDFDATLKLWRLAPVYARSIMGFIEGDKKRRFRDGESVITSSIQRMEVDDQGNGWCQTLNTLYKLEGKLETVHPRKE